jgi:hypothetical protein
MLLQELQDAARILQRLVARRLMMRVPAAALLMRVVPAGFMRERLFVAGRRHRLGNALVLPAFDIVTTFIVIPAAE